MGKLFKIIGGTLAVLVGAVVCVPMFFSDKVEAYGKQIANDYIKDATVDFKDFSLSVFSSFPSLRAGFEDVSIIGTGRFNGDTLLHVGSLGVDVDLLSALKGDIVVNGVLVDNVLANAIVTADSVANWDIVALSDEAPAVEEAPADTASAPLKLSLDKVELSNVRLAYADSTANIAASVSGLNAQMTGTMDGNVMALDLQLGIDGISAALDGVNYLSNASAEFKADAVADLDSMKFTFNKNRLDFAGLPLAFDGWVQMADSSFLMDMRLAALESSFKTILDLVPAEMLQGVEGLQTSGSLKLYAMAKGEYKDLDNIPQLAAVLKVNNGFVQYPDLPKSLNDINVSVVVRNPGGSADLTTVDVDTLHLSLGNSPFDVTAHLATPLSNLTFDFGMLGTLNLGALKEAMPLDSMQIDGLVKANVSVSGDMASVEAEQFDKIKAVGQVGLSNFLFGSADLRQPVQISNALLAFSPQALRLDPLDIRIGKSDFSLTGNVENYLAYVLGKGSLLGKANLRSQFMDCNELMALSTAPAEPQQAAPNQQAPQQPAAASEPLCLPTDIDFTFNTNIAGIVYDRLSLQNITGVVRLAEGVADLSNLSMETCDGRLAVNGTFATPEGKNSKADLKMSMTDVNINKLVNSFSVVDSMLPIARSAYGAVNIGLNFVAELDNDLNPIMQSVNGGGNFASQSIELKDSEFQHNLSKLLRNEKYNTLTLKDARTKFTITDGNIVVEPFPVNMLGKTGSFGGRQGLDQTMDYRLTMPIARKEVIDLVGKTGLASIGSFNAEGADLPVGVVVGGQLTKPALKLDLSEALAAIKESASEVLKDKASEGLDKVADKVLDNIKDDRAKDAVNKLKDGLSNIINKKK